MKIKLIKDKISKEEIKELAESSFGSVIKIVVDVERGILAAGGEFHADAEQLLLKDGSEQENLWGANFYPYKGPHERIEYSALINIRPRMGNKSMRIENDLARKKVKETVENLLLPSNEQIS